MFLQIITKNKEIISPAKIFSINQDSQFLTTKEVYEYLDINEEIFIIGDKYNENGDAIGTFISTLHKTEIFSIFTLKENDVDLNQILTLSEAAKKWGLADGSSIRKAIERNRFNPDEIKQAGSVWIITYKGMCRVFGDVKKGSYTIYNTEFDFLLNRVNIVDTYNLSNFNGFIFSEKKRDDLVNYSNYDFNKKKLLTYFQDMKNAINNNSKVVFKSNYLGKEKIDKIFYTLDELFNFIDVLYNYKRISKNLREDIIDIVN